MYFQQCVNYGKRDRSLPLQCGGDSGSVFSSALPGISNYEKKLFLIHDAALCCSMYCSPWLGALWLLCAPLQRRAFCRCSKTWKTAGYVADPSRGKRLERKVGRERLSASIRRLGEINPGRDHGSH